MFILDLNSRRCFRDQKTRQKFEDKKVGYYVYLFVLTVGIQAFQLNPEAWWMKNTKVFWYSFCNH